MKQTRGSRGGILHRLKKHLYSNNTGIILKSPQDGHCILHSVVSSWAAQLPTHKYQPTLSDLKCKVFQEIENNIIYYQHLCGCSVQHLKKQRNDYLEHKIYNNDLVDIIPNIMSEILKVKLCILNMTNNTQPNIQALKIQPIRSPRSHLTLYLQRLPDHYNGLKLPKPDLQCKRSQHNTISALNSGLQLAKSKSSTTDKPTYPNGTKISRLHASQPNLEEKGEIKTRYFYRRSKAKYTKSSQRHHSKDNFSHNLRILTANIRGLRSNYAALATRISDYDIVCLQETFLTSSVADGDVNIPGYELLRRDRRTHGGGVAIYYRSNLCLVPKPELHTDNNHEVSWFMVCTTLGRLFLACVYRPPTADCSIFQCLEQTIENLHQNYPNCSVIVCGDTNAHHTDWSDDTTDKAGRAALAFASFSGLTQIIREPTLNGTSGRSVIDHIYTDLPESYTAVKICHSIGTSDHCAIELSATVTPQRDRTYRRTFWLYHQANWDEIRERLDTTDWSIMKLSTNVDESWKVMVDTISNITSVLIPSKSVRLKANSAPWFNHRCYEARNKKVQTWRAYNRYRTDKNVQLYREACKNARSVYHTARLTYRQSLVSGIENFPASSRQYWSLIKSVMGSLKVTSIPVLNSSEKTITSSTAKAELLNSIFVEKSTLDDEGRVPSETDSLGCFPALSDIDIPLEEVWHALQALDCKKAMGPDGLSPLVLKVCADELASPLTDLFRSSLNTGVVPQGWKVAHVTPIHKGGGKSDPNNYRPISLLPIISKIFETLLNRRIQKHLLDNKLISDHQFGFLPGRSSLDLLTSTTQRWSNALDSGSEIRLVALDISRAFDRVWHNGLLARLRACKISGNILKWIENFLTNRQQAVVVNGQRSTYQKTNAGVPQGSVLGPTLFLVFINTIFNQVKCNLDLFADDSTLHQLIPRKEDRLKIAQDINNDLSQLAAWADSWCINFNAKKTKVITITHARDRDMNHPQLIFQGHPLPEEECLTLVGVKINKRLSWNDHIRSIATKAEQRLGALLRCSKILPPSALLMTYKNFVRSTMEYCSPVWSGGPKTDLSVLDKIQRRAMWACCVDPDNHKLCLQLGVRPLSHRRTIASLCLLYRIITGKAPPSMNNMCPQNLITTRQTRSVTHGHSYRFQIPRNRTNRQARSFLSSTIQKWNDLPPTLLMDHPLLLSNFKAKVSELNFTD